jgi:hypothetical protein
MTFVTLLRRLWRHKVLVSLALIAGIAVGVSLGYKVTGSLKLQSRDYKVGVASARILVDTPSSQIVDLGKPTNDQTAAVDIGTLSARANLLASLMTSSPIKDDIAAAAGVQDGTLLTPGNASGGGSAPALAGEDVKASSPKANILRASVPELAAGEIPIIAVETQAPDPAVAAKIADQSVVVLTRQLNTLAGTEAVPADRRVTIRELGPARSTIETRGPSRVLAAAGGIFTFLGGCLLILLIGALVNGWRSITAQERAGDTWVLPAENGAAAGPRELEPVRSGAAVAEADGEHPGGEVIDLEEPQVVAARFRAGGWRSRHDAG